MFIEAEWYNDTYLHKACGAKDGAGEPDQHGPRPLIMTLNYIRSGDYEFTVDKRLQYGQKNSSGTGRFVVWHDESRKPYQVGP